MFSRLLVVVLAFRASLTTTVVVVAAAAADTRDWRRTRATFINGSPPPPADQDGIVAVSSRLVGRDIDQVGTNNLEDLYRVFEPVKQDYQTKAFSVDGWRVLRKAKDGSIEIATMESKADPHCPLIRFTLTLPKSVSQVYQFLHLHNWDRCMPCLNPFYGGTTVVEQYKWGKATMSLARIQTKRILSFSKRDFGLVSITSSVPDKDSLFSHCILSVMSSRVPRRHGFVRGFQDMVCFFEPLKQRDDGGNNEGSQHTRLVVLLRTDLNDSSPDHVSGYIPMWVVPRLMGTAGYVALDGLRKMIAKSA